MNCKLYSGCKQNSIYFSHIPTFHRIFWRVTKRTLNFVRVKKGTAEVVNQRLLSQNWNFFCRVFNSSCFLVSFDYEKHIFILYMVYGITVKWIRNICFLGQTRPTTPVEKFMLIYQNLCWSVDAHIHPHPLAALNLLLKNNSKRNLWNVFLFSWHDKLNLKQFYPYWSSLKGSIAITLAPTCISITIGLYKKYCSFIVRLN